jgi:CheY-like chemotaxis protein
MLSWLWMLRRKPLETDTVARALDAVERNARVQARLVDDLLDVSRIVTGKLQFNSRRLDLGPVVEAATESLMAAAEAKAITLVRSIESLSDAVLGDADRLQQVIWNLVANAIKFTPRGGRVEIGLRRVGPDAEVHVTDTGVGIAPHFLPYVFERFRQADGSTTRPTGGLGLGLAIVRQLVELHGGRVEAHSAGEGRGASFVLSLPLTTRQEEGSPAAIEDDEVVVACRLDGLRVLIVEDEVDMRDSLQLIISRAGGEVAAVGGAREALIALRTWRPDVLVCDIGLPFEDGYSLICRVRALATEEGGAIPAVALTAYAQESDRARALAAGFQAHLTKPFEPGQLLSLLARSAPPRLVGGDGAEAARHAHPA